MANQFWPPPTITTVVSESTRIAPVSRSAKRVTMQQTGSSPATYTTARSRAGRLVIYSSGVDRRRGFR